MIHPMMLGGSFNNPVGGYIGVNHVVNGSRWLGNGINISIESGGSTFIGNYQTADLNNAVNRVSAIPSASHVYTNQTPFSRLSSNLYDTFSSTRMNVFDEITSFVVPNAAILTLRLWGGGGGAGGFWTSGSAANGGGGGYVYLRLNIGTDVQPGDVIHCLPGTGGMGGHATWYGGVGGGASLVWVGGNVDDSRTIKGQLKTLNSLIAVAGGGGGGGARNWSVGAAGAGGSGNSPHAGNGFVSANNAGATSSRHGLVGPNPTSDFGAGINGGVYGKTSSAEYSGGESDWITLSGLSNTGYRLSSYLPSNGSMSFTSGLGGGGAFSGAFIGFWGSLKDANSLGPGGGGGSSKVYKGTLLAMSSRGIDYRTDGSNSGYGVGGRGTLSIPTTYGNARGGLPGMPGRIVVRFDY